MLLEKDLRKSLVKCFVWNVALFEIWTLRWNERKRLEVFEMWIWRRMEHVKLTHKIKNAVMLERVGEGRIMLPLKKEEENKLAEPLAKKKLHAEGCSRRYGKQKESSRHKKISDCRQNYDKLTT